MKVMITKVPDMKPIKTGAKLFGNGGPATKSSSPEREELEKNKAYNDKKSKELKEKMDKIPSSKRNMNNPEYASLYNAITEQDKIKNYFVNYDLALLNDDIKALQSKIQSLGSSDYETSSKLTTELNQLLKSKQEKQAFVDEHGIVKIDRAASTNTPVNKPTEKYQNSPFTTTPVNTPPPVVEQPKKTFKPANSQSSLFSQTNYNDPFKVDISQLKGTPKPIVPQTGGTTNSNTPVPITPKTFTNNSSTPQGAMSQQEWYERAVKKGYSGENNPGAIQDWMVKEHPDDVVNYMTGPQGGMTNYGKKLFGNKDIKSYSREELLKGFRDGLYERRGPLPGDPSQVNSSQTGEAIVPITEEETTANATPNTSNSPYPDNIKQLKNPEFTKGAFDYSQYLPEALDMFDRSVRPWTKKYSPELLKPNTLNIQSQLNDNQADAYYGMQNLGNNPATRNANIANLMAQKYAANNSIYNAKYNADSQSRNNVDNANSQLINQAEQINYGRAKNQVDEQSQLLENEQAKKHSLFSSLVNKKAQYENDQQTKKFWFDILSKNYSADGSGNFKFDPNSVVPFTSPSNSNDASIYAPKPKKVETTTTQGNTKTKVTR